MATNLPKLAKYLSIKDFTEAVIPHIATLLRDESPEVKQTLLKNFGPIADLIDLVNLSEMLSPILIDMKNSYLWRVSSRTKNIRQRKQLLNF